MAAVVFSVANGSSKVIYGEWDFPVAARKLFGQNSGFDLLNHNRQPVDQLSIGNGPKELR